MQLRHDNLCKKKFNNKEYVLIPNFFKTDCMIIMDTNEPRPYEPIINVCLLFKFLNANSNKKIFFYKFYNKLFENVLL